MNVNAISVRMPKIHFLISFKILGRGQISPAQQDFIARLFVTQVYKVPGSESSAVQVVVQARLGDSIS